MTVSALPLRDYQHEAVVSLLDPSGSTRSSGHNRLAVVLPTGMGKTVIFAEIVRRAVSRNRRPLILVHRDELVRQAIKKIRSVVPGIEVGVVKAERNEWSCQVVVASVQTLSRASRLSDILAMARDYETAPIAPIIVDECHHAAADSYVRVLQQLGSFDGVPTYGFTATLSREDNRSLSTVWQSVAYERDILWGIEQGWLCDVRGVAVDVPGLDLAKVSATSTDYRDGSLGEAMAAADAGAVIARAYREHASDRQGVVFAPTVAQAFAFADALDLDHGIPTATIVGTTPFEERQLIYKRLAHGDLQVVSNCGVLTEGWDAPHISCAVIGRPTASRGLYTQMVGRILRPYPGKADALVLDVAGVSASLPLTTWVDLAGQPDMVARDGESLHQAVRRHDEESAGRTLRGGKLSAIEYREVDLFHRASVWLTTKAGRPFVATSNHLYLLHEDADGSYRVGKCQTTTTKGGEWLQRGLTLSYALAWAETMALAEDPSISSRTASWRKKKSAPPSPAQLAYAVNLGIDVAGLSKVELADRMTITLASRILDERKATR